MDRMRHVLLACLLIVLAAAPSAAGQAPLKPPETLAQEQTDPVPTTPTQPEPLPGDEDDEELGEEIPDEEPPPPEGDSGSSGGPQTPAHPPAGDTPPERVQQQADPLPRTGNDPVPLLALAAILISSGLSLRARVRD